MTINPKHKPYDKLTVSKMKKHMTEFNRQQKINVIKGFHKLNKSETLKLFNKYFEITGKQFSPKDKYLTNMEENVNHSKFRKIHSFVPKHM